MPLVQTLNEVEKMKKRLKLKPFVLPTLYVIACGVFVASIFLLNKTLNAPIKEETPMNYVTNVVGEQDVPVVNVEASMIRPYTDSSVQIAKYFYDKDAEEPKQEQSIIYHENTYLQNSGSDYTAENTFDVVSVFDGTVIEVEETELLGKSVKIRHDNDIISVYQSLSEVSVKENDTVTQGQTIGKSGTSTLDQNLGNHLHFELYYQGQVVDPENYFDKKISDF